MKLFGGGGNEHSGAARIKSMTIEEVKKALCDLLIPTNYLEEAVTKEKVLSLTK